MKLTFLGTGTSQGVPVITCSCAVCQSADPRDKRLRTSALVEVDGKVLVIDTGPDYRQQMLREEVMDLHAVLVTHAHRDHVAGLDDVRAYNFKYERDMPLYCNPLTAQALRQDFRYIFSDSDYPGLPRITLHEVEEHPFLAAGVEVQPIPVMHHKLPVLGFRIGDMAYVTDANFIPPHSMERLKGLKLLVLNALRFEEHISHFNVEQALAIVEALQPELCYFTHFSHLLGRHEEVEAQLPEGVRLAYDGLVVEI